MTGENVCSNCGNDFGPYEVEWCPCGNGCLDCCDCWQGEFDEDEPDGQPDEMQEWADYDPDC